MNRDLFIYLHRCDNMLVFLYHKGLSRIYFDLVGFTLV